MHSFHHSRGRILFEVFCALVVAGSFLGAWQQTGASAFLPAALASGLWGLWHLTDLRQPRPAMAPAVGDTAAAQSPPEPAGPEVTVEPVAVVELEPAPEALESALKPAARPKRRSRKKQPAAEKAAKAVTVEAQAERPVVQLCEPAEIAEDHHAPIVPLFEAQPIVRQQRAVFGRKAG
jgi:hypothetical protein